MKWPCLDAGELRHQIMFLRPELGEDASGASMNMVPFVTTYAKIEVMRGTDFVQGGQVTSQATLVISTWWQDGITANMQIRALNGTYIIRAVENVSEMNIVLKMDCISIGGE